MRKHDPDYFLMAITAILVVGGLIVLYSASSVKGALSFGDSAFYLKHQVRYGILPGLLVFLLGYITPYRWFRRISIILLVAVLVALSLIVFSRSGVTFKGASRWLRVGSVIFQPAEFLKLALILYFSSFFANRSASIANFWKVTLPFLFILGISAAMLIAQPATGTLGIVVFSAIAIYFFAGARMKDIFIITLMGVVFFFALLVSAPYRLERVKTLINSSYDPKGVGYQINQAKIAIGSGGMWGVGLGHSRQKYNFLPEAINDSIFAIYAEETGFFGSMILILMFLVFAYRGFRIAISSRDTFSRLLAGGIVCWIVGQAFINIASISGLWPLTGVPLPFVSYGGSAMVAVLGAVGILLNISRYTVK